MTDMLKTGSDWLAGKMEEFASREVVYQRPDVGAIAVNATIGKTLLRLDDGFGGLRIAWTDRDFMVRAEDLVMGGIPLEPEVADEIVEITGAITRTYQVNADFGEPHWRWADDYYTVMRIRTKLVRTEGLV